jgi:hypothetical protein
LLPASLTKPFVVRGGPVGQVWAAAQSHQRGLHASSHCWSEQDVILRPFFTLPPLSPSKKIGKIWHKLLYVLCHPDNFCVYLFSCIVVSLFFEKFPKKNPKLLEFNYATPSINNDVRLKHILWLIKQSY